MMPQLGGVRDTDDEIGGRAWRWLVPRLASGGVEICRSPSRPNPLVPLPLGESGLVGGELRPVT